jgi:putative Holliday junction resolvase
VSEAGRLLGVDYGQARVGLAVSDAERRIASPVATYTRRGAARDAAYFQALVKEQEIVQIVVGLPVHLDGREGKLAAAARAFGKWLAEATSLPVTFWDERFTSVEAEAFLREAGLTDKGRNARRDRVAAQILLQSYLEAGCPGESAPRPLEG